MKRQLENQTFIKERGSDRLLLKRSLFSLLSCLLIFTTLPITSLAKETNDSPVKDEVIYGNLKPDGTTKDMYVVNSFEINKAGKFIDYGFYEDVRNLTDLTDITLQEEKEVHFEAENDFFYQGTLKNQPLPWHISITYLLDGKKVSPEDIIGASGQVTIQIETTKNTEVDPVFFEYYLLQVNLKFDPLHFNNIQAPKGTEANEGKDKLISFSVMPDKEEVMIVSADVKDFEMDPIDISAVPANISFESPDTDELASDMQQLSDAIQEINNAVLELEDGATDLSKGASELSDGSNRFLNGINELNASSAELVNGSEQILDVFKQINEVIGSVPEIPSNLIEDLKTAPQDMRDLASGIRDLAALTGQFTHELNNLPEIEISSDDIDTIIAALNENQNEQAEENEETNEINAEVIQSLKDLAKLTDDINHIQNMKDQIPSDSEASLNETANEIDEFAIGLEGLTNNIGVLDELDNFKNGLSQLSAEYQTFHNGLVEYTNGVDTLAKSYNDLNAGTKQLADGVNELKNGTSKLQDGTQELADETSNLAGDFESEIDEFMDEFDFSDFEPISFVSSKNQNVNVVQFVLQTESLKKDEVEDEPETKEEKRNIWERFLDLFK